MSFNKRVGLGLLLLVLVTGGAFLFENIAKVRGSQNGKLVPVVQSDKTIAYLNDAVIRQLSRQERELKQGRGNPPAGNVSLGFALGSVGIVNYEYVVVSGVDGSGDFKFNPGEMKDINLAPNNNGTFAMFYYKENENQVLLKEVARFYVVD